MFRLVNQNKHSPCKLTIMHEIKDGIINLQSYHGLPYMRASSILLWKRRKIWLARKTIYLPCISYIAMDSKVYGILMLFCSLMIMIDIRHKVNTRMIALGIDSNNNQLNCDGRSNQREYNGELL